MPVEKEYFSRSQEWPPLFRESLQIAFQYGLNFLNFVGLTGKFKNERKKQKHQNLLIKLQFCQGGLEVAS